MSAATQHFRRRFFAPLQEGVEAGAKWIEWIARSGYLAIGIVYSLLGLLAIHAALTAARTPNTRDVLSTIGNVPFGPVLLGLLAIGLASYAVWRFVQAWWDTERRGRDWRGAFLRVCYAISGAAYVLFAYAAIRAAIGVAGQNGESARREGAAELLQWPGGWFVLLVIGGTLIGVGITHFVKAYNAKFMHDYEHTEMSQAERDWAKPIGRFGLTARGVTFCLIGVFVMLAGWQTNAGEVKGLGDAFETVAAQPFGQVMLLVIATGFVAYGVFCISQARYRRIEKL
jgi:hypothetical protein